MLGLGVVFMQFVHDIKLNRDISRLQSCDRFKSESSVQLRFQERHLSLPLRRFDFHIDRPADERFLS